MSIPGTKSVDPVIVGAIGVAVAPVVLTKILEFIQAWTMRREGQTVRIKVQTKSQDSLELEVPITMSRNEVRTWINFVFTTLNRNKE